MIQRPNLVSIDSMQSNFSGHLYKPQQIGPGFALPVAMHSSSIDFVSLTNWESVEVIDLIWIAGR